MKSTFILLITVLSFNYVLAQTPNTHLDIESIDKGILIPRMDSSVRNAIIPNLNEESLLVYDNDLKQFMFWDGSDWSQIGNKEQYVDYIGQNILMGRGASQKLEPQSDPQRGKWNVILGHDAGALNKNGTYNTFLGRSAGNNHRDGSYNVFLGGLAGSQIDTSSFITAVGYNAGRRNKGSNSSYFGAFSGHNNTSGRSNTFIGSFAGSENETGSDNTYVGTRAGQNSIGVFRNTFIGSSAGFRSNGNFNTFIGNSAGGGFTTGFRNISIGMDSGRGIDGNYNIMIGTGVGFKQDTLYNISNSIFLGNSIGNESPSSHQLIIETNDNDYPLIKGNFLQNTLQLNGKVSSETIQLEKYNSSPNTCDSDHEGQLYYDNSTSPGKVKLCSTSTTNTSGFDWVDLN